MKLLLLLSVLLFAGSAIAAISESDSAVIAQDFLQSSLRQQISDVELNEFRICVRNPSGDLDGFYSFFCRRRINNVEIIGDGVFVEVDKNTGQSHLGKIFYSGIPASSFNFMQSIDYNQAMYIFEHFYDSPLLELPEQQVYQGVFMWRAGYGNGVDIGISAQNGSIVYLGMPFNGVGLPAPYTYDSTQYYLERYGSTAGIGAFVLFGGMVYYRSLNKRQRIVSRKKRR